MPTSGSSRGQDAVEKARKASSGLIELKFPDRNISDQSLQLTAPLELKYFNFNNFGGVKKSRHLSNLEVVSKKIILKNYKLLSHQVACLIRVLRDTEQNFPNPGSAATLLVTLEDLKYATTGELKGVFAY